MVLWFFGLFLLALVLALYYPVRLISSITSSTMGAPFEPLAWPNIRQSIALLEGQRGQLLADLGSGDGRVLVMAHREFGLEGIGYEIAWYPYLLCRFILRREGLNKQIQIRYANFYKADLSAVDLLYIYQEPRVLANLQTKLLSELKSGAKIVSPRFAFPEWKPLVVDHSQTYPIYLYAIDQVRT